MNRICQANINFFDNEKHMKFRVRVWYGEILGVTTFSSWRLGLGGRRTVTRRTLPFHLHTWHLLPVRRGVHYA